MGISWTDTVVVQVTKSLNLHGGHRCWREGSFYLQTGPQQLGNCVLGAARSRQSLWAWMWADGGTVGRRVISRRPWGWGKMVDVLNAILVELSPGWGYGWGKDYEVLPKCIRHFWPLVTFAVIVIFKHTHLVICDHQAPPLPVCEILLEAALPLIPLLFKRRP